MSQDNAKTKDNLSAALQRFCGLYIDNPDLLKCGFILRHLYAPLGVKTYGIMKNVNVFLEELLTRNIDIDAFIACFDKCIDVDINIETQHSTWTVTAYFPDLLVPGLYKAILIRVSNATIARIAFSTATPLDIGSSQYFHSDIIDGCQSFISAFYEHYCKPYIQLNQKLKELAMSIQQTNTPVEPEECIHMLDDGTTETDSQRMARMESAIETVLDIGSKDYGGGQSWVRYIERAMKFRTFAHKFNSTNFAKHLGLVFTHEGDIVHLCGHRVGTMDWFATSHKSFFKLSGLQLLEIFTRIAGNAETPTPEKPRKVTLRFADKNVTITVKNLNGRVPDDQIDGRDEAIEFDIEANYPLRQQYLEWNGLWNSEEPEGGEEYKISLLEYISYINNQFLKNTR